jgi:hypothetical protein
MSYETILIHRDIPVIDGFMATPPNEPLDNRTTDPETFISGTNHEITRLSLGSGKQTGAKFGQQEWVRLAGIRPDEWYATDPLA